MNILSLDIKKKVTTIEGLMYNSNICFELGYRLPMSELLKHSTI